MTIQSSTDPYFEPPAYESALVLRLSRQSTSIIHPSYWWLKDTETGAPQLGAWADDLAWWLKSRSLKNPTSLVASTKPFIAYLLSLNSHPLTVAEFTRNYMVRKADSPKQTLIEFLHAEGYAHRQIGYACLTDMRRFFEDWYDEFRPGIAAPRYPIQARDVDASRGRSETKTVKETLPARTIKLMK